MRKMRGEGYPQIVAKGRKKSLTDDGQKFADENLRILSI